MSQVTEIVKNMFHSLLDLIIESGSVDTYMIFFKCKEIKGRREGVIRISTLCRLERETFCMYCLF